MHFDEVCVCVCVWVCVLCHEHVWVSGLGLVRFRSTRAKQKRVDHFNEACDEVCVFDVSWTCLGVGFMVVCVRSTRGERKRFWHFHKVCAFYV